MSNRNLEQLNFREEKGGENSEPILLVTELLMNPVVHLNDTI